MRWQVRSGIDSTRMFGHFGEIGRASRASRAISISFGFRAKLKRQTLYHGLWNKRGGGGHWGRVSSNFLKTRKCASSFIGPVPFLTLNNVSYLHL